MMMSFNGCKWSSVQGFYSLMNELPAFAPDASSGHPYARGPGGR